MVTSNLRLWTFFIKLAEKTAVRTPVGAGTCGVDEVKSSASTRIAGNL